MCAHTQTHTFIKISMGCKVKVLPLSVPPRTRIYSLKVNPDDLLLFEPYVDLLLVYV